MSKFIIVEQQYHGIGMVKAVEVSTKHPFESTVSRIENVLNDNDISVLLQQSGTYVITRLILNDVFMIDYSKLDIMGENDYHTNAAARNWSSAEILTLDSMQEIYDLGGDDDFMVIDLSKAASTHDARSIELDFCKPAKVDA